MGPDRRTIRSTRRPFTRRWGAAFTAVVLIAASVAFAPATNAGDLPSTVQNLQHTANSIRGPRAGNGLMVFTASEGAEQRDLNGDGIIGGTNTNALQVWDSTTGQIHSLMGSANSSDAGGLFWPEVQFDEGIISYLVDEGLTGLDLNGPGLAGDGDLNDDVMHVWTRAGGVTNLGFDTGSALSLNHAVGGGKVVFNANEAEAHPEVIVGSQDLNGDGDALDTSVMLVWDELTGSVSHIGDKKTSAALIVEDGGLFAWVGDPGETYATVRVYDASNGSTTNCCVLPGNFNAATQTIDVRDGYVGFAASYGAGVDYTFVWWDLTAPGSSPEVNSGIPIDIAGQGVAALANGWMAFVADETAPGVDLNGDGDTSDNVLHLWDPVAGSAINSGLALDGTYDIVTSDSTVAFVVDENEQGADLNGDGDISGQDRIVHIWPIGDPLPTNSQLGMLWFDLAGSADSFAFAATQAADGSTLARRVHGWTPTGGLVDLGVNISLDNNFSRSGIRADNGQFALMADELATGSDLDGDGLISNGLFDAIPTVWDPVSGLWHAPNPGQVTPGAIGTGNGLAFTESHAMFVVRETPTAGPGTDLNCDGDTADDIIHVTAIATTPAPTPCTYPVLTPGGVGVTEGHTGTVTLDVPITLSAPSTNPVTVDWATIDPGGMGIARAGIDYVADAGVVTFAPGETTQSVQLTINGDTTDEPPLFLGEWALVQFTNPSAGATLDLSFFGLGIGVIIDDDPPPTIMPGTGFVTEGDAGTVALNVAVTLSNPSAEPVTVDWTTLDTGAAGIATADVDYVADSGTVTFAPGQTTQTVQVAVNGDTLDEPDLLFGEWVLVPFSNPSANASLDLSFFGLGIGVIVDDDT